MDNFQFQSVAEFLWMEGHGPYVWAAYAITATGLLAMTIKVRIDRQNFYKTQASIIQRQQRPQAES